VGISDESDLHAHEEPARQMAHDKFDPPALLEEYPPGGEYTLPMLGNGRIWPDDGRT
jgi:hypothetical protein